LYGRARRATWGVWGVSERLFPTVSWNTAGPESANVNRVLHDSIIDEPVSGQKPPVSPETPRHSDRVDAREAFEERCLLEDEVAFSLREFEENV
jgi:hypothetical protein